MTSDIKAAADPFKRDLLAVVPNLRAFAVSLCGNPDRADDLVQDAILKAWGAQANFQPGSNIKAWIFTILRNEFYSQMRKRGREVQDSDGYFTEQSGGTSLAVRSARFAGLLEGIVRSCRRTSARRCCSLARPALPMKKLPISAIAVSVRSRAASAAPESVFKKFWASRARANSDRTARPRR